MVSSESCVVDFDSKPECYFNATREDMLEFVPAEVRTAVEFGCGNGKFAALVKERRQAEVWGVEIQPQAAQQAAQVLDRVICEDALQALKLLPDHYFDCALFLDVLEHLVDPYSLLVQVKEKLTDQGVVVASIPNIRYYRVFWDFVWNGNWDYKEQGILDSTHLRFFTRKSILKMFKRLGYQVERLEGIHPTRSRTFRILNACFLNRFADVRYKHFVVVARPNR